jgi:hypothetical protein
MVLLNCGVAIMQALLFSLRRVGDVVVWAMIIRRAKVDDLPRIAEALSAASRPSHGVRRRTSRP